jgi:hypothetical protein
MDYEIWAATDGSPNAANAVVTAIHWAQAFTARLTLVAVDVSVGGHGPYYDPHPRRPGTDSVVSSVN